MDFSTYKFRCSGLKNLMTKSKTKEPLSVTTKTYLKELWIQEVYGRRKEITSKYMSKGTIVESDSLDLLEQATGKAHPKNKILFENPWITGTPDVVSELIIDIKSSWDIWTFAGVDEKKAQSDYYLQLLGYMWLTDKRSSELVYALVNTPEEILFKELEFKGRMEGISDYEEVKEKYERNYIFNDIPAKDRIKTYSFTFSEEIIEELKSKILVAREYMQGLTL